MLGIDKEELEIMKLYLPYVIIMALSMVVVFIFNRYEESQRELRDRANAERDFWKDAYIRTNDHYQTFFRYENLRNNNGVRVPEHDTGR